MECDCKNTSSVALISLHFIPVHVFFKCPLTYLHILYSFNLVDLPESEKLSLSLCCHKDRPTIWKAIYFECLSSGKHFLEQVLVSTLRSVVLRVFVVN